VAYGRRVEDFARQCIFFGTSNTRDFLKDPTGERRWWPLDIAEDGVTKKNVFVDLTDYEVGQLWAEAYHYYIQGENIYLPPHIEEMARVQQEAHSEENPLKGMIENYLDLDLPDGWDDMELSQRQMYVNNTPFRRSILDGGVSTHKRNRVCGMEIWCEVLEGTKKDFTRARQLDINNAIKKIAGWKEGGRPNVPLHGQQRCYVRSD